MAQNFPDPSLLERMSSEVAPETSPLLRFLIDNSKRIAIVAVVFVAAAVGYGVYNWQAGKAKVAAQHELGKILTVADSADRFAKLKAFRSTAPDSVTLSVTLALAKVAADAKDYDAAAEAWNELAADKSGSLYVTAVVGKAENLAMAGKHAEALTALDGMTMPADSSADTLVNALIVDIAEKSGNIEKAVAACEKLMASASAANPEEADFWRQKAAALRLKGKAANS